MMRRMGRIACLAAAGAVVTLLAGCGGDGEGAGARHEGAADRAALTGARGQAYRLWQDIRDQYPDWPAAGMAPVPAAEPHGAWIRVHYNDVAAAAAAGTGAWPDGAIIVAEDFAPDPSGPGVLEAVSVMHRRDGAWFWVRFTPPESEAPGPRRLTRRTDIAIAGGELLQCASCHRQLARRDHVISELR
jgi:hypothetical protein